MFRQMNQEEYEAEMKTIIDADILIHDAQYTPEDYKKKKGWGHSCYIDIINMAIDANVKNLYLFSHDPNNDDEIIDGIHKECLKIIENKKNTFGQENIKKGNKKCQKVHFGNPDPNILESGKMHF